MLSSVCIVCKYVCCSVRHGWLSWSLVLCAVIATMYAYCPVPHSVSFIERICPTVRPHLSNAEEKGWPLRLWTKESPHCAASALLPHSHSPHSVQVLDARRIDLDVIEILTHLSYSMASSAVTVNKVTVSSTVKLSKTVCMGDNSSGLSPFFCTVCKKSWRSAWEQAYAGLELDLQLGKVWWFINISGVDDGQSDCSAHQTHKPQKEVVS